MYRYSYIQVNLLHCDPKRVGKGVSVPVVMERRGGKVSKEKNKGKEGILYMTPSQL